jgi:hypothetical protein
MWVLEAKKKRWRFEGFRIGLTPPHVPATGNV